MKKSIGLFVVALVLLMMVSAQAQTQVQVGGLLGLNMANLSLEGRNPLPYASRTAFGLGGVVDISLPHSLALRLEPMYLQKGAKAERPSYNLSDHMNYLELPILAKYTLTHNAVSPYVMAGPTLGFLLSANRTIDWSDGDHDEDDLKDALSGTDLGLTLGGGASSPWKNYTLFVEARYGFGFKDIAKSTNSVLKTKGLQFMVGGTIPLGKKGMAETKSLAF